MRAVVFAVLLFAARSAHADPAAPPRWLAGIGNGGPGVVCCNEAPFVATMLTGVLFTEGAYRPSPSLPLWVRAMIAGGQWELEQVGSGSWWQVRGGGEFRPCVTGGGACAIFDADVGFHRAEDLKQDPPDPTRMSLVPIGARNGLAVAGRAGLDLGGRYVRFRIAIDYSRAVVGDFRVTSNMFTNDYGRSTELELGVAAQF